MSSGTPNIGKSPGSSWRASASIAPQRKNGRPPRARRVRFWLTSDRCSVLIQVWDGAAHHAVRQEAGLDDETGRGLPPDLHRAAHGRTALDRAGVLIATRPDREQQCEEDAA